MLGQSVYLLIGVATISLFVLMKGADWLVDGATALAYRIGMPKVLIGATVVSLGTTTPECAVSVLAAYSGNAGLALGNAVGSVIADTALIFGLGCLICRLPADRFILSRQGWIQFFCGVLLAAICYGAWFLHKDQAAIPRSAGFVLLGLLVAYMWVSVIWARHRSKQEFGENVPDAENVDTDAITETGLESRFDEHPPIIWQALLRVLAGLVLVIFSAHFLIESISQLALRANIPEVVIAATLVAFGTSLPELVVGIASIRKGHPELLVGNVLGADILNVLFVIGASACAAPLPVVDPRAIIPEIFLYIHLPTMLIVLVYFRLCIAHANRQGFFSRWMGGPLVIMYVAYTLIQFLVSLPKA